MMFIKNKIKDKKSFIRDIVIWGIVIIIAIMLYTTGYHVEIIGFFQRIIICTGIMKPDIQMSPEKQLPSDYNWKLISIKNEILDMRELKGKVLFINFWATWCPPCVAEMPDINNLYKKIKSDRIIFLMVSLNSEWEKVKEFIKRNAYTFPVYRSTGALPSVFSVKTIPTTFVISPDGKIVMIKKGIAKYDTEEFKTFLKKMTEEKIPELN